MDAGNSAPRPANAAMADAAAVRRPVSARAAGRGVPYRCRASSGMYLWPFSALSLTLKVHKLGSTGFMWDQTQVRRAKVNQDDRSRACKCDCMSLPGVLRSRWRACSLLTPGTPI